MRAGLVSVMVVLAVGSLQAQDGASWVEGPAGRLRVENRGSGGPPIVFVHALAGNRSQWDAQVRHLRPSRRTVTFDLRGHGESDPASDGDYSLEGAAADLAAVVDALGLRRVVLVGHSFGGGVVAIYAGHHPNRVAGILFADPIGDQRPVREQMDMIVQMLESESYEQAATMYYQGILNNAALGVREPVLEALRATERDAVVGAFRSLGTFDPVASLGEFSGPMVSVISDINNFPTSLHNVVPDLPNELITGTSHWLQMDRPEEFNAKLDAFLRRAR